MKATCAANRGSCTAVAILSFVCLSALAQDGPRLAIQSGEGGVNISWSADTTGFALESAARLTGGWAPVPGVIGALAALPTDAERQFFRLRNATATAPSPSALRLDYATFLGGRNEDRAHGMAVDGQGNIYLTAPVQSTDFPTTSNALKQQFTGVFLAKLNPTNTLIYSTFLGAVGGANYAHGVAVDKKGCIYIAGNTTNPNFPTTPGAFQRTFRGPSDASAAHGDAFVMKLSPAGDRIIYSTFLGGTGPDICGKIAVDEEGNAYVLGATSSRDFPVTPGAFQGTYKAGDNTGHGDVFVAKLNPDGGKLVYSTYIGGSGTDFYGDNMVVDADGSVCFAGFTASPDFPTTTNAFGGSRAGASGAGGATDAFVARLNPTGTALEYASYIGGSGDEIGRTIAVDSDGNIWLAGDTTSTDFPTTSDAYGRQNQGGTDGFLAKINPRGGPLLYSSLFGGRGSDSLMLAMHRSGLLILACRTDSADLPVTPGALYATPSGQMDIFVALFDPAAHTLRYGTYFGGHGSDAVAALVCQGNDLYLAGNTTSADFPVTSGAWDKTFNGGTNPWGGDAFAVKFTLTDKNGAPTPEAK